MKAYKKTKLAYENGYIMKGDTIVVVEPAVVRLLNKLELDYQKALFNYRREVATEHAAEIMAEKFEPQSERASLTFEVETPHLDKLAKKSMKIMDELDDCANASKANNYLKAIGPVVQFVTEDKVFDYDRLAAPVQFDLPNIGNPLELDADRLMDFVNVIFN